MESRRRRKSSYDIVLEDAPLPSPACPAAPPPPLLPPAWPSPRGVVPALEGAPEAAVMSSSACDASMPTSFST